MTTAGTTPVYESLLTRAERLEHVARSAAAVEHDDARPTAQRGAHQRVRVVHVDDRNPQGGEPPLHHIGRSDAIGRVQDRACLGHSMR